MIEPEQIGGGMEVEAVAEPAGSGLKRPAEAELNGAASPATKK
jgi:hypothetical protein